VEEVGEADGVTAELWPATWLPQTTHRSKPGACQCGGRGRLLRTENAWLVGGWAGAIASKGARTPQSDAYSSEPRMPRACGRRQGQARCARRLIATLDRVLGPGGWLVMRRGWAAPRATRVEGALPRMGSAQHREAAVNQRVSFHVIARRRSQRTSASAVSSAWR
jgi:hypothetical protein